jgi:tripeptidyl-peptidase-1
MPSYQSEAVHGYLEQMGDVLSGLFNTSGRAYPDVAALGGANNPYWYAAATGCP